MTTKQVLSMAALAGLVAVVAVPAVRLLRASRADDTRQERERVQGGRDPDQDFCAKNRAYYESFCRSHPANCTEGPTKLARCVPW